MGTFLTATCRKIIEMFLILKSQLTVDPFHVDCWFPPPNSTLNSVDCQLSLTVDCWPSLLTVDPWSAPDEQLTVLIVNWFTVDCWSSLLPVDSPPDQHPTVLIVNHLLLLIVDPLCWVLIIDLPLINSWQCCLLTLSVNCWSLICPWSRVNSVDCQPNLLTVDCWLTPDEQLTVLIVNWFTADCWPFLLTIDPLPPKDQQWTVLIVDCHTVDCWPSLLTINCQCTPPVNRPYPLPKTWDEVGVQNLWFEV